MIQHLISFILTVALLFSLCVSTLAQESKTYRLQFSLEPNLGGKGDFTVTSGSADYVSVKPFVGIGVNFGVRRRFNPFFAQAELGIYTIQRAVRLDYNGSGYNQQNNSDFGNDNNPFGSGLNVGLRVLGGYTLFYEKKHAVDIGMGFSTSVLPITPYTHFVNVANSNKPTGMEETYGEVFDKYPRLNMGINGMALYNFRLKSLTLFTGFHYRFAPAKVEGRYTAFKGYTFESAGTVRVSQSFASWILGVRI